MCRILNLYTFQSSDLNDVETHFQIKKETSIVIVLQKFLTCFPR